VSDGNWAMVSCSFVSLWLTVPYFFLVSMGALQSIPQELTEAAHVDGGGPWQIFRRVTLPLLLVATSPLLIASFAFNFNNFNNIFLLTGGGPTQPNQPIAGSTDILISYTYKLALATGKGQDFGLASSVSIIISAAFSREDSVSGTSYLPTHFTVDNFSRIVRNRVLDKSSTGYVDSHFLRWLLNTILVASVTAIGTVILGSLAAYAFSRFRF